MEREGAALGIFLTLNPATREMEKEAASAGFYETGGKKFPRVQILTAAEVIDDRRPQVPFGFTESLKKASRGIGRKARIAVVAFPASWASGFSSAFTDHSLLNRCNTKASSMRGTDPTK